MGTKWHILYPCTARVKHQEGLWVVTENEIPQFIVVKCSFLPATPNLSSQKNSTRLLTSIKRPSLFKCLPVWSRNQFIFYRHWMCSTSTKLNFAFVLELRAAVFEDKVLKGCRISHWFNKGNMFRCSRLKIIDVENDKSHRTRTTNFTTIWFWIQKWWTVCVGFTYVQLRYLFT